MKKILNIFLIAVVALFLSIVIIEISKTTANESWNNSQLNELFTEYYQEGYYTKETKIYIDPVKINDEVRSYFHNNVADLEKTTIYKYDEEVYTTGNIEANYDASDEACEAAADRINAINDRFFSQPFANDAEAAGMVSDRIPNEPAAWITSSWGAEAKITFDQPIKDLVINKGAENEVKISDIIQAYQWKASTKVNVEKNVVDCFSLVVELIRRFNNDVRFFEKKSVTEDVAGAFDLDFPEV
jgi:hypothetical protein